VRTDKWGRFKRNAALDHKRASMSSTAGYPTELTRARDGSVYARVAAMDAWGHATLVYMKAERMRALLP